MTPVASRNVASLAIHINREASAANLHGEQRTMTYCKIFSRRIAAWAPLVFLATGCMGGPLPGSSLPLEQTSIAPGLPQFAKNHVHVFLLQGLDPLDPANLGELREYLISQGFIKTSLGPAFYGPIYAAEVRRLHRSDPDARFVLVGQGYGVEVARTIAKAVRKDQATVDLLIAIDAGNGDKAPEEQSENVALVVNIHGQGWFNRRADLPGVDNANHDSREAVAAATNAQNQTMLTQALVNVAGQVAISNVVEEPLASGPTPRGQKPVPLDPSEEADWSFLRADTLSQIAAGRAAGVMSFKAHEISFPGPNGDTAPPADMPPTGTSTISELPVPRAESKPLLVTTNEMP